MENPTESPLKTCIKCGKALPLTDFSIKKASKDNRNNICLICDRQRSKERYRNNPEYFKRYRKENHENIRSKVRECSFLNRPSLKSGYLRGTGICIFCGEINPFLLEIHHPFGKEHPLEIHECANCHCLQHRLPAMLEITL